MAYTTPRTYTTAELVTAAILNSDVRDNLTWFGVTHDHNGDTGDGGQAIPASLIGYYNGTTAPSGWTALAAARGYAIVGLTSGGSLGGTVLSALTDLQSPNHTHTYNTVIAHTHNIIVLSNTATDGYVGNMGGNNGATGNYSLTTSTGASLGTTASTVAHLPYIQYLPIVKN